MDSFRHPLSKLLTQVSIGNRFLTVGGRSAFTFDKFLQIYPAFNVGLLRTAS